MSDMSPAVLGTVGGVAGVAGLGSFIGGATSSGGVSLTGVALGTLGVVGMAAGGYTGYQAYQKSQALKAAAAETSTAEETAKKTAVETAGVTQNQSSDEINRSQPGDHEKRTYGPEIAKAKPISTEGGPVRSTITPQPDGTVKLALHVTEDEPKKPILQPAENKTYNHQDVKIPTKTAAEHFSMARV